MVISAYAELMLDTLAGEHPLRHNVEEIMTAVRRATALTRQLLAFGRKQLQNPTVSRFEFDRPGHHQNAASSYWRRYRTGGGCRQRAGKSQG